MARVTNMFNTPLKETPNQYLRYSSHVQKLVKLDLIYLLGRVAGVYFERMAIIFVPKDRIERALEDQPS